MATVVITPAVVRRGEWAPPASNENDDWQPMAGPAMKFAVVSLTTNTGDYVTGGVVPSTALATLLGWTTVYSGRGVYTDTVNYWANYIPASGKIQYSVASTGAEKAQAAHGAATCYMVLVGY